MARQFLRKASLVVTRPGTGGPNPEKYVPEKSIDLSQLHFQFKTTQQDDEGPNNCTVRVFNVSRDTVESIVRTDFSQVVVQGGYDGTFGIVFAGTIKQFRVGRQSATDSYLDILAADTDLAYNYGVSSASIARGQPQSAVRDAVLQDWSKYGVTLNRDLTPTGGTLPRGKVLWGMARAHMRNYAESQGATWSMQNGQLNIIPRNGYLPGEAVRLTSATGLIGTPEATQDGVKLRCLLNPGIVVGGRVQVDNKLVNQTINQAANSFGGGGVPFDKYGPIQYFANVTNDGFYRVYIVEHVGDTRGQDWYSEVTALAIDTSTDKVNSNG